MKHTTDLYFESHITIEPVYDDDLDAVSEIASKYKFKVADLLMKKRLIDTEERSQYDTFMTTRSKDWDDVYIRTLDCIDDLIDNEFQVWRFKIENTLLDIRFKND